MTLVVSAERLRAVLGPVHPIDEDAVRRLVEYTKVLDRWAARQRLVGWRRAEALLADGLRDAWSAVPLLAESVAPIVDVGSGSGLPALVYASGLPDRVMHLVESRRKRVSFLREAVRVMGVSSVVIHHGRTEDIYAEQAFDPEGCILTSRAFAAPVEVLELGASWGVGSCLITSSTDKIPSTPPRGWSEHDRRPSRPFADSEHVFYRPL